MAGSFSVGALAIAHPEANVVGAVRLTLMPRRMELDLLRGSSFRAGFVPSALTRRSRIAVPYHAVRAILRRGEGVLLVLDPRVVAPYSRLMLAHFTDLPLEALASAHQRRAWMRKLGQLVPLAAGVVASALVPARLASGPLGTLAVGGLTTVAFGLALRWAIRALVLGGVRSSLLRDTFEARLTERLALEPPAVHDTDTFDVEPPRPARPGPRLAPATLPLVASGVVVALVGLGVALGFRRLTQLPAAPPRAVATAGLGGYLLPDDERLTASRWPSCACERADSPVWRGGFPALTVLPMARRRDEEGRPRGDIAPEPGEGRIPHYDFDLGVVNNGALPLANLRVLVTFARRDARGRRANPLERGLFWEGPLAPGDSVKWAVRGPGTELKIEPSERRLLGEGAGRVAAAKPEAFLPLLEARQPAVRLHAATMLAWLGDERARAAVDALGGLGAVDERTRRALARALGPVRVCDAVAHDGAVEACVHNAGDAMARDLELYEPSDDGAARTAPVPEPIEPKSGRRIRFDGFGALPDELAVRESPGTAAEAAPETTAAPGVDP